MFQLLRRRVLQEKKVRNKKFRAGELVPQSGIYRVSHDSHRLMHEATLVEGNRFPICKQCKDQVRFELRRAVKEPAITGCHALLEDYPEPPLALV